MRRTSFFGVALVIAVSACNDTKTTQSGQGTASVTVVAPPKKEDPDEGKRFPPCHPGCFPAGTAIATPTGTRPIETIKPGELVTLIGRDGVAVSGPVHSIYTTDNRLVEVRTEAGTVMTTDTQPLCLAAGGFQTAGGLKAADVIWRWADGRRQETRVTAVVTTDRDAPVFNLVVGESAVFVAGGFLARGKPPLAETGPTGESK
jgi:hypothetical protein